MPRAKLRTHNAGHRLRDIEYVDALVVSFEFKDHLAIAESALESSGRTRKFKWYLLPIDAIFVANFNLTP